MTVPEARTLLDRADRVVVLTGAGISAESGVPTFRGEDGLWKEYRAEDLATPQAFQRDPRLVWEWYAWRRDLIGACEPNAAHLALARFARSRPGVTLVTQNVDGLHALAARLTRQDDGEPAPADDDPAMPLELHGSIFRVRCTACGRRTAHRAAVDATDRSTLPACRCGGLLRPDVVWFGEMLPARTLEASFAAAKAADICLVVGTSALVHPAASVPLATLGAGGDLIEGNPEPTPLSGRCRVTLRGGAATTVPRILDGDG